MFVSVEEKDKKEKGSKLVAHLNIDHAYCTRDRGDAVILIVAEELRI